jgi:hypothetical protein
MDRLWIRKDRGRFLSDTTGYEEPGLSAILRSSCQSVPLPIQFNKGAALAGPGHLHGNFSEAGPEGGRVAVKQTKVPEALERLP